MRPSNSSNATKFIACTFARNVARQFSDQARLLLDYIEALFLKHAVVLLDAHSAAENPFAVLTAIVAPAILTNACSMLYRIVTATLSRAMRCTKPCPGAAPPEDTWSRATPPHRAIR